MPHKQCYCQSGWFGERCELESPIKTAKFDASDYQVLQVLPDYRLHWRILPDTEEIEVVAMVNGTSWVGLGWRPLDISPLCQMVPHNYKYGIMGTKQKKGSFKGYDRLTFQTFTKTTQSTRPTTSIQWTATILRLGRHEAPTLGYWTIIRGTSKMLSESTIRDEMKQVISVGLLPARTPSTVESLT
jgi:hypothetical protein